MQTNTPVLNTSGFVPLVGKNASPESNWALLRVSGADATAFLQTQLSNDIKQLDANRAQLSLWCNAKGRVLASFVVIQAEKTTDSATYLLLCRADLLANTIKRLQMFVLRSKVKIENASDDIAVYGLLGDAAMENSQTHAPWSTLQQAVEDDSNSYKQLVWLAPAHLYADQQPRALCLQSQHLPEPAVQTCSLADWEWSNVCSGVATIEQASADSYVPQMLNFESVEAISFKKGCYPGQEVVARCQYRGVVKRRAYVATAYCNADAFPQISMPLWCEPSQNTATQAPQECGEVVQVALRADGYMALIVCLQNSAVESIMQNQAKLLLGSPEGIVLQLHPLAYRLLEI